MTEYIEISKNINMSELAFIRGETTICDPCRAALYRSMGFNTPRIGFGGTIQGYDRTNSIIFPITKPSIYNDTDGNIDTKSIIDSLDKTKGLTGIRKYPWILLRVRFLKIFPCTENQEYISLLYKGYSMSSINMERTVDDHRSPQRLSFESKGASITVNAIGNNQPGQMNMLKLSLEVKKERLKEILGSRAFSEVDFNKLEAMVWDYYLNQMTGGGDYMYLDGAKERIYANKYSSKVEERYIALLNSVQRYKGIEPFLSHIGKPDPKFKDISLFKDIRTAKRDIQELEKLGINPVTIPCRAKISNEILLNIRKL